MFLIFKRLLLLAFSATLLLGATAATAAASTEGTGDSGATVSTDACNNPQTVMPEDAVPGDPVSAEEVDPTEAASSMLLPVNRWGDSASTFYSNLDQGMFEFNVRQQSREQIGGFFFSASSNVWEATVATSVWATAFCPIDAVGHQIDSFLGTFGGALLDSGQPLIMALLLGLLVVAAWGSRKGTGFALNWKSFFGKIGIITFFIFIVNGAQDSYSSSGGTWDPAGLSPGNIVTTTNTAISDFGGLASSGLMNISQDGSYAQHTFSEGQQTTDCRAAISAMHAAYESTFDGAEHQGLASQVPVAISDAWVNSVYVSYSRAQQGPFRPGDDGTGHSPHHYSTCYILDWTSPAPILYTDSDGSLDDGNHSDSNMAFVARPMGGYFEAGDTFRTEGSDGLRTTVEINDRNVIRWKGLMAPQTTMAGVSTTTQSALAFWSVCRVADTDTLHYMDQPHHWEIAEGFAPGPWTPEGCAEWYGEPLDDDGSVSGGSLDDIGMPGFALDGADINAYGLDEYETEYINYINGMNPMGAVGAGFTTLASSVALFLIFGGIGLAVVAVRAALLIVMIYLFVTALVALLPGQGFQAILKAFKMLIGVVMLSVFAQVAYSLIIGLSTALNGIGSTFLGFGTVGYIVWVAITPLLAVLGLHFVFKWAKLPSPFTPKGAMAWGKGLSSEGGSAAGGAFGGSGSAASSGRRVMSNVSKGYRDASLNRAVDRSGSREGQMEEAGRQAQQGRGRIGNMRAGYGAGGVAGAIGGLAGGGRGTQTAAPAGGGDSEIKQRSDTSVGGGGAKAAQRRGEEAVMADSSFEGSKTEQEQVAHEAGVQARDQYKDDAAGTRQAHRAAKRQEFQEKYVATKPGKDGKRRLAYGRTAANMAGGGLDSIRARGVKSNLKTAAKVAGIGAVAAGVGSVPAAALAGAWGAKRFGGSLASKANRGLASRGLGTKAARAQFAGEVDAYVAGGRQKPQGGEHTSKVMASKVAAAGGAGAKWTADQAAAAHNRAMSPQSSGAAAGYRTAVQTGSQLGGAAARTASAYGDAIRSDVSQKVSGAKMTAQQLGVPAAGAAAAGAARSAAQYGSDVSAAGSAAMSGQKLDSRYDVEAYKSRMDQQRQKDRDERATQRTTSRAEKDQARQRIQSKASQYVGAAGAGRDAQQFLNEGDADGDAGGDPGGGQPTQPAPSGTGGSGGAADALPDQQGGSTDDANSEIQSDEDINSGGDGPKPQAPNEGTAPENGSAIDRFSDENYKRTYRRAFSTQNPNSIGVGRPENPQPGQAWVQEGDSWYRAAEGGRIDRFDAEAGQWRRETGENRLNHEQAQRQRPVIRKDEQGYGSRSRNRNIINPERGQ